MSTNLPTQKRSSSTIGIPVRRFTAEYIHMPSSSINLSPNIEAVGKLEFMDDQIKQSFQLLPTRPYMSKLTQVWTKDLKLLLVVYAQVAWSFSERIKVADSPHETPDLCEYKRRFESGGVIPTITLPTVSFGDQLSVCTDWSGEFPSFSEYKWFSFMRFFVNDHAGWWRDCSHRWWDVITTLSLSNL